MNTSGAVHAGRPQALKEIEQKWVRATILGVVGAVLVIISAFLPWVEFYAIEITASYLGSPNESGIDGVYGKISLGLGLAALVVARWNHNYSGCEDQACDLCDAHGEGYSAGKAKRLFECALATIHMRTEPDCRCSACTALMTTVQRFHYSRKEL